MTPDEPHALFPGLPDLSADFGVFFNEFSTGLRVTSSGAVIHKSVCAQVFTSTTPTGDVATVVDHVPVVYEPGLLDASGGFVP